MYFCHNCGTQLREDARFCHNCGAEQIVEQAPKPPVLEWSKAHPEEQAARQAAPHAPASVSPPAPAPTPVPAPEPKEPEAPQVQIPLPTGSYTWKNVKISGEFKNGTGSITITFN